MQILNSGFGKADENTIVRPENPQRRDVMIMPPGSDDRPSYLVIQWDADNPGVWYV
jgi:FtsP/CotA-like multicopper oxidase with cupredoxin domain